jgi:sulfur carrier protein
MEINLNNQLKKLPQENITLQQLLQQEIPGRQQGIAVAINNKIVPKNSWEHTRLVHQDNIIIIRATQGG